MFPRPWSYELYENNEVGDNLAEYLFPRPVHAAYVITRMQCANNVHHYNELFAIT